MALAIYERETPDRRRQIEAEDSIPGSQKLEMMRGETILDMEQHLQNNHFTVDEIFRDARAQYTRNGYNQSLERPSPTLATRPAWEAYHAGWVNVHSVWRELQDTKMNKWAKERKRTLTLEPP